MDDDGALFTLKSISKYYLMGEMRVDAIKNIDLTLYCGEVVVILGPSGSGKSTLLNILGGLDTPSTGSISYKNFMLSNTDEKKLTHFRRYHVGFIFQFYNLINNLTAKENVTLVTDLINNHINAIHALNLVGLNTRIDHFPSQLSGGEQQRVAIARAIAKKPEVLLCDEPTGALDCQTGKCVLNALLMANKTLKTSVIIITHNACIASVANRVIHMADGVISHVEINANPKSADTLSW
jgi:putative ABC transport system ATP-binding protein